MNQYDQATIERVIEEVTREVLLRLNQSSAQQQSKSGCNCSDGSCTENCADKVQQVVQAGAARVTSTLGVRPQSTNVARLIDHTLLKADASHDQIAQLC
jgi:deoxyribose-phosphate aldolase